MKIAVLSHNHVGRLYAAELAKRGHEIIVGSDGGPAPTLDASMQCDGCLLLGDEQDLLEIAYHMELVGKPVWHDLTDIPE